MMEFIEFLKDIFFYSGYIANKTKSFPKPLSAAEEREYIARYAAGDENAREKLIEHNLRLVVHIAKKYSGSATDKEDYISIGTIGLIKGVNTFSPEKNIRLATYVSRCIENEILMYLRKISKRSGEVSFGESIGEDNEGNKISLIDVIGTDGSNLEEQVETLIHMEKIRGMISKILSPREMVVISLRYGIDGGEILPQRAIAEKLGISRSYVSRLEKKALEKLKALLDNGEIPE